MFKFLKGLIGVSDAEEAFNRFILPEVKRAREAGLSEAMIDRLVRDAINESDGYAKLPGALLRRKIDDQLNIT